MKTLILKLFIIYEDDDVAVINKAKGMVVHPGAGNYEHTLANALINKFDNLSHVNGEFRPGIVHRIDKDTSGLVVVAKNDFSHNFLSNELKDHSISRKYYTLVKGEIKENSAVIRAPIGRDKTNPLKMCVDTIKGKEAESSFKVIKRFCCVVPVNREYYFIEEYPIISGIIEIPTQPYFILIIHSNIRKYKAAFISISRLQIMTVKLYSSNWVFIYLIAV